MEFFSDFYAFGQNLTGDVWQKINSLNSLLARLDTFRTNFVVPLCCSFCEQCLGCWLDTRFFVRFLNSLKSILDDLRLISLVIWTWWRNVMSRNQQFEEMQRTRLSEMLAVKRSVGVTPEVNLRNPLHAGEETCKRGIHSGFETQGRRHQKSKTGVSVAPQKGLGSSENLFLKTKKKKFIFTSRCDRNSQIVWYILVQLVPASGLTLTFQYIDPLPVHVLYPHICDCWHKRPTLVFGPINPWIKCLHNQTRVKYNFTFKSLSHW